MMAGNPSWWSMHPASISQQPSTLLSSSPSNIFPSQHFLGSSSIPLNSLPDNNQDQLPQSWSQLLMGGSSGDEEKFVNLNHLQPKKLENYENQIINPSLRTPVCDVKQVVTEISNLYGHGGAEFQAPTPTNWPQIMPVSSPRSCVTSLNTDILNFSSTEADGNNNNNNQNPDHSSECNSTVTGEICKKARVQSSSSSQPPLKVRKEKLGDRITALHQLVSPFGKTDTASVLLEAIGYIRFLQGQIEALSSPYLDFPSANLRNHHHCMQEKPNDLRSRGLCLVPVSCTQQVGSDNGADYWAPALGGGF
ncbi:transcription factor bHLH68-like isoform X2 [Mangifera indica]|uniref:transcription factor bHLH68-like isoform X2 n=1 Tax=Mangifera indica TaxID=29780 RepID=UPI001CFA8152|nr:transcription factor bHLH68-like isoform X2 [Mangifera indica]